MSTVDIDKKIREIISKHSTISVAMAVAGNEDDDYTDRAVSDIKALITNAQEESYTNGYIDRGIEDLTK